MTFFRRQAAPAGGNATGANATNGTDMGMGQAIGAVHTVFTEVRFVIHIHLSSHLFSQLSIRPAIYLSRHLSIVNVTGANATTDMGWEGEGLLALSTPTSSWRCAFFSIRSFSYLSMYLSTCLSIDLETLRAFT